MTLVGRNQQKTVNTTLEVTPLMPFANVVELHHLQEYLAEQQEQEELVAVLEGAAPQVDTLREVRGTLLLELDTLQVEDCQPVVLDIQLEVLPIMVELDTLQGGLLTVEELHTLEVQVITELLDTLEEEQDIPEELDTLQGVMATPREDIQQEERQDTLLAGTDTHREDMDTQLEATDTLQEDILLDILLEGMDTHQEDMGTLQQDMDIQQGAMDTLQEVTLLDTQLQEDTLLEDMDTLLGDMDTLQEDMDTLQEVTPLDIPLDLLEVDTTQDIPMENRNLNDDGSETAH